MDDAAGMGGGQGGGIHNGAASRVDEQDERTPAAAQAAPVVVGSLTERSEEVLRMVRTRAL